MKKNNSKKTFFNLSVKEKTRIVEKAASLAIKDQLRIVAKHGGINNLKNYSNCN